MNHEESTRPSGDAAGAPAPASGNESRAAHGAGRRTIVATAGDAATVQPRTRQHKRSLFENEMMAVWVGYA